MASTEIPEVFELMMLPGFRNWSTLSNNCFLICRFSTTTSMIQSTSFNLGRSSSKLPASISDTLFANVKGAGFCFINFFNAFSLIRFRTALSWSVSPFPLPLHLIHLGQGQLAKWGYRYSRDEQQSLIPSHLNLALRLFESV